MELKDVILATIAEIGEEPIEKVSKPTASVTEKTAQSQTLESTSASDTVDEEERLFLERLRERLLVLFEGFQSPNNQAVEAKVDLTINFLEYLLAMIEERLERLDAGRQ